MTIDSLWRARNDLVFNQQFRHSHVMVCIIRNTVVGIQRAAEMEPRTRFQREMGRTSNPIHWIPPPHGWVKVNCDGSRSPRDSKAACEGIGRTHTGGFCFAFTCNLGDCSVLMAELWAILYGVRFVWARGYRNIIMKSDSQLALGLLLNGCPPRHPAYAIVHEIKQIVGHANTICYGHTLREANQVADCLAKFGHTLDVRCCVFETMPSFLSVPCLADRSFVPFPRGF